MSIGGVNSLFCIKFLFNLNNYIINKFFVGRLFYCKHTYIFIKICYYLIILYLNIKVKFDITVFLMGRKTYNL